jgi:hypothetical protein
LEAGTLTTKAEVLTLSKELRKLSRLLPDRATRKPKGKAKSSRPTASKPRKAKASASGDAAAAQTPAE